MIDAEELSQHGSVSDCWLEIHGIIYDVTKFLYEHPGGEEIIVESAGKIGAGPEFDAISHSSVAEGMLKDFRIGKLKK